MKDFNPGKVQQVSDLRDDDSIYSNEKAMLLMFDKEKGIENFNGSGIEKSTENSKFELLKRIDCIEIVHKIRNILATQCFIGLVGLQDSGRIFSFASYNHLISTTLRKNYTTQQNLGFPWWHWTLQTHRGSCYASDQ